MPLLTQRPVERWHTVAILHAFLHPALLHAASKRVGLVVVDAEPQLVGKNAFALHDAQLAGVLGCVRLLHRDQQLRAERWRPLDLRPKVPAEILRVRVHENVRTLKRHKVQRPLFVRLEQIEKCIVLQSANKKHGISKLYLPTRIRLEGFALLGRRCVRILAVECIAQTVLRVHRMEQMTALDLLVLVTAPLEQLRAFHFCVESVRAQRPSEIDLHLVVCQWCFGQFAEQSE